MNRFAMFQSWSKSRLAFLSCSAFFLLTGGGCGSGGATLPSDEVARAALEGALKTWRDGGKPGTLAGTNPPAEVHDTPWSQGERLGSYEILAEKTSGAEKQFTVRLSLTKPQRVQEVQYYVLGQGPVMVFRDEDYLRNINMEDGPKLIKPGNKKSQKKR
jgi:hypothetical protein